MEQGTGEVSNISSAIDQLRRLKNHFVFHSGDLATIRQVSVSKALEIAKKRAQHQPGGGAVMTWTVDRYLSKPRAVDARVLPVDPAGETYLAQVVVKLETSQVRRCRFL